MRDNVLVNPHCDGPPFTFLGIVYYSIRGYQLHFPNLGLANKVFARIFEIIARKTLFLETFGCYIALLSISCILTSRDPVIYAV